MLTPYASGTTVVPGALRALGLIDLQRGNLDAATQRFDALLATGAQTYESLFHLGAIAEQREDTDRRAAQLLARHRRRLRARRAGRASRVSRPRSRASRRGCCTSRNSRARGRSSRSDVIVAARARCCPSSDDERGALARARRRHRAVSGLGRAAHGARVPARAHRPGRCVGPRAATAAHGATGRCGHPERARLHAGRSHARLRRGAHADRERADADAGQRRRARQHGLGAVSAGAAARGAPLPAARARARAATPRSTCTSARCCGRSATKPRRARPGRRRSSAARTTKSCKAAAGARRTVMRGLCSCCWPVCWPAARVSSGRSAPPASTAGLAALSAWIATGRLAVAAEGEGGSGSFVWQQQGAATRLQSARARSAQARSRSTSDGERLDGHGRRRGR